MIPTHEEPADPEFGHAFRSTMGEAMAIQRMAMSEVFAAYNFISLDPDGRVTFAVRGNVPMVTCEVRLAQG